MTTPREKFQTLLRELFQFDNADLDFGIYRIMNHKRAVIEQFIEKDLLNAVSEELQKGALAQEASAAERLAELIVQIKDTLGVDALDVEGKLNPIYSGTKIGKEYLSLQQSAGQAKNQVELESQIFNHLYAFFSRYYHEGDFMSLRRYSRREKYAIPYNGEEVYLHWANSDQYYIKTGENFTDYSYKHGHWTVRFKLRNADVEQNNVKGAKRFFVPQVESLKLDVENRELTLPFEYRPLVSGEETKFGKTKIQEAILAEAMPQILAAAQSNSDALAALVHEKRRDAENNPVSLLEHHLRTYTQKNTRDFFIHKDLKGFLERELDFYLKNEVLNLDELRAVGQKQSESWFESLRIIAAVGGKIIDFISQIEEFQKRLFEKKKFITEVGYCVRLDLIPSELYKDIQTNRAQIQEWKDLFRIHEDPEIADYSEPLSPEFLMTHPNLLIDTRHFDERFFDKLISSWTLDEGSSPDRIDGLLVHAENLSALDLLGRTLNDRIKCIYIDPPYNRGGDDFNYKDSYQHSSWLAMVMDRLRAGGRLLRPDGAIYVSIDEHERINLENALAKAFGGANRIEELIWAQNTTHSQSPAFSTNHEYVEVYSKNKNAALADKSMFREPKPGFDEIRDLIEQIGPHYPSLKEVEEEIANLMERHHKAYKSELEAIGLSYNTETKKQDPWRGIYPYNRAEYRDGNGTLVPEAQAREKKASLWVWRESDPSAPAGKQSETTRDPNDPNYRFYEPINSVTGKKYPPPKRGWGFPYEWKDDSRNNFVAMDKENRIVWGKKESSVPQYKRFLHEVETNVAKSVIHDYTDGEKQVANLFGVTDYFRNPKPSTLIERFIMQTTREDDAILDYFAGSGTTGHATIDASVKLRRRLFFFLIETGEHFDTTLIPRIKKLLYTRHWESGKPRAHPTAEELQYVGRAVKYLRLESYEDALDNIVFGASTTQPLLQLDDYVLSYMLDFETKDSDTFLHVSKLDSPFDYKLHRHGKDEPLSVDLSETFNYLIGLHVRTRRVYENEGTRYLVYRGQSNERETVIIWRTTRGWGQKEFEADRKFIEKEKLTSGAEDIFVNTDSFVKGAVSLDPVFKRLMFNEE
jgi:adenine-specific DNA-methyltransferase